MYALFKVPETDTRRPGMLSDIQKTMLSVWDKLIPIAQIALRVIAPVIVLLVALGVLHLLRARALSPLTSPNS